MFLGFPCSTPVLCHDTLHVRIGDQFRGIDSAGIASIRRVALGFHRAVGEEHSHHIIGYGHLTDSDTPQDIAISRPRNWVYPGNGTQTYLNK